MPETKASTQDHLDIVDIRDSLLILKGGVVALVVQCSAINFDLLSEGEQDAMIGAYASLLNSLAFPLQVIVRSKKVDISNYIDTLRALELKQKNKHLKKRIEAYLQFVENLVSKKEVLNKSFYIVIRYGEPLFVKENNLIQNLLGQSEKKPKEIKNKANLIEKANQDLGPRLDHLIDQLGKIGIESHQLSTQELVTLFYEIYNPSSAYEERLQLGIEEYTAPIVEPAIE